MKQTYDEPLSKFIFNLNLRCYTGDLAETALVAADAVQRLGLRPAVAMLSSSNFGSRPDVESALPVRLAVVGRCRVTPLEPRVESA